MTYLNVTEFSPAWNRTEYFKDTNL